MKRKKKKMGRPPLKPSERRSIEVNVRMTPGEKRAIDQEARATGATASEILMRPWRKEGD